MSQWLRLISVPVYWGKPSLRQCRSKMFDNERLCQNLNGFCCWCWPATLRSVGCTVRIKIVEISCKASAFQSNPSFIIYHISVSTVGISFMLMSKTCQKYAGVWHVWYVPCNMYVLGRAWWHYHIIIVLYNSVMYGCRPMHWPLFVLGKNALV